MFTHKFEGSHSLLFKLR